MPRKKSKGKNGLKKGITIFAVMVVILCVSVAFAPFVATWWAQTDATNKYNNQAETSTTIINQLEDGATIDNASENYLLDINPDKTYTIKSNSYLDYDATAYNQYTKNGEPYEADVSEDYLKLIVTDDNGTAISNKEFVITAYAYKTPQYVDTVGGMIGGAVAGAAIGTLIEPGIGTLIGAIIGTIAGGIAGYVGDNWGDDKLTLFDHQTVIADAGTDFNEIKFGKFGGDSGRYSEVHLTVMLADSTLLEYSPMATTNEIVTIYPANVYCRLINGDAELLKIQNEIKESNTYQGMREAECGHMVGYDDYFVDPYGGHDAFYGLDTADTIHYEPMVSNNTNNHVFQVTETRFIATKDITGIDLHQYPVGAFAFQLYFFDTNNNHISPEFGMVFNTAINDIDNDTCFFGNHEVNLESYHYYTIQFTYVVSTPTDGFFSMAVVQYEYSGSPYMETLGKQGISFDHSEYITSFQYTYNYFFGEDQIIHRQLYDLNDKIQLIVDYNSPFYLNETSADFTIRYFVAISGSNSLFPSIDGNYYFNLNLQILDGDNILINDTQTVGVGRSGIASGYFSESVKAVGIQELKSYELRLNAFTAFTPIYGYDYMVVATYTKALYFILKDYEEFREDVRDLQGLIDSLKESSDLTIGTYDTLREILAITKPKVDNLVDSINDLKATYPDIKPDCLGTLEKSLKNYKDYDVRLLEFMDTKTPEDVAGDGALFSQFKAYMGSYQFYYSDVFALYNSYIAYLKGEHQISQQITNTTKGFEDYYQERADADKNRDVNKYLPPIIIALAIMISTLLCIIFYYFINKKFKNKYIAPILTLIIFGISFIVIYLFLNSVSGSILNWWYGWNILPKIKGLIHWLIRW